MRALTAIDSVAIPMPAPDIDTDQIVPARFMHKPRVDYGRFCFHDLRFDEKTGRRIESFVLNAPAYDGGEIIVAGPNFGCGSSREQAVHVLQDFGIRAIVGTTFGDIFSNNCLKNGVLVVRLDPRFVVSLFSALEASPGSRVVIDLPAQTVRAPDGTRARFDIDAFYKAALLAGRDEIDITLQLASFIDAYEAAHGIGPHGREKDQEDRPNRQGAP